MKGSASFCIIILLCVLPLLASEKEKNEVTTSGFIYYQIGQIERSFDRGVISGMKDKAWDQHCNFRLTVDAKVQKRLRIVAGVEMGLWTVTQGEGGSNSFLYGIVFKEGQGIYTFGDEQSPFLQIALGYFPFKYNPQATNMGEYLFTYRAGAYPPYIINDFDNCKSRLLGLRVSSEIVKNLRQDALFTNEMTVAPYGDYSLSYVVGYRYQNYVDIGGGISFNRLIPLDPELTTSTNVVTDESFNPVVENGDTLYFTMKALKMMARMTFDPKAFFPSWSFFGAEDGKLYGEMAILGLKNYGATYEKVSERMPVMLGFNIPTCKVLDFISFEYEHFGYPMMNDIANSNDPKPTGGIDDCSKQNMHHWSFFAQKTVVKGLCIKGLIGKDHYRWVDAGGNPTRYEPLRRNGDWHYNLRFMYSF